MQHLGLDPDSMYLIGKLRIEDKLQAAEAWRRAPASRPVNRLRTITGTALMAADARIAAMPRPAGPLPGMGEVATATSLERA